MSLTGYHHLAKARAEGAPLVFAFHGTGGDEHQFFGLVGQFLPRAGIVAPRGDVSEHGAARFFRRTGEGVYDMDDLARRTAANPDAAVYGLGYSNGANILASVLFNAEPLFDRVVLMHPLIPFAPPPNPTLAGLDVLITAGRRDPICPLPLTQSLDQYFRDQGAVAELSLEDGGHAVTQAELDAIERFLSAH
jgi:phospholipase/carboxylesterase